MKILIDIGHPAHVHYFRNFIKIVEKHGHLVLIISRNKEIEQKLLRSYCIAYVDRGKGANGFWGKFKYFFKAVYILYKKAKNFKPDILLSFGSPYLSFVSKIINKPHIMFNDTEHAKLSHLLSDPFSKEIITPACYNKSLGGKQIRIKSFMELCYLHEKYFKPDSSILKLLGVKKDERYIILRFVSWNASHDVGQAGFNVKTKYELVKELSKFAKIFISSEEIIQENFKKYQIKIPPEKMHDALAFATLFIGEGATMASECTMLGIPAIYVNSLSAGTLEEQVRLGLLFSFRNSKGVLDKIRELLMDDDYKRKLHSKHIKMIKDQIDPTAFMVWFVENYPQSAKIMKENPEYQNRFK